MNTASNVPQTSTRPLPKREPKSRPTRAREALERLLVRQARDAVRNSDKRRRRRQPDKFLIDTRAKMMRIRAMLDELRSL